AYIFIVFGYLSRLCERQADLYGCRAVSCSRSDCLDHEPGAALPGVGPAPCPTGINTFMNALEKVAYLNGISRDRPGWLQSWQHGSIAQRVEFLSQMRSDLTLEPRFQRRLVFIKIGLVFGLAAILTVAGALVGRGILLVAGERPV